MYFKIAAIIFLFPIVASAQSITGYVLDSVNHFPISGIVVETDSVKTTTNTEGLFEISGLSTGSQLIHFSGKGYSKNSLSIKLAKGETKNIKIYLVKSDILIDEVLVSASRSENRLDEIPGRINLISSDRINLLGTQTIDEQLKFVPGVHVSRSFGIFSHRSSVTMRGLSGNEQARTLVLLDDIPYNKADGGSVNWNLISTMPIQRIEVVKGPGSALFGGNAMGGIINVLSQKPIKKFQANVHLEYGTYNTKIARSTISGKIKVGQNSGLYWSTNLFYQKSDGYITQSEADQKANPFIIKSNVNEKAIQFVLGYTKPEKFESSVNIGLYDGIRGTGEKVFQPEGNTTQYRTYNLRMNLKGKIGGFKWSSSAFLINENYIRVNEFQRDDYTWYEVFSVRTDFGLLNSINYKFGRHSITSGFDIRNGRVDATDIYYTSTDKVDNKGKMDFYGFYIQDDISLLPNLKLLAGLRYDLAKFYDGAFIIHQPSAETEFLKEYVFEKNSPIDWGAFSPRISMQFKRDEGFRIYAGYSRGFRPSVLDDLCRTGRIRGGLKVARPDLKPEHIDNFEIGGDYSPIDNLKLAASLYYSMGKDFLYYVSTGDSIDMGFGKRPVLIRSNISNVEIYGAEFEVNAAFSQKLTLFANYAYSSAKIIDYKPIAENDPVNLKNKYLTDVPKHAFSAGAIYKGKIVNAGFTCRYTGAMYVNDLNIFDEIVLSNKYPDWFTIDLKISKDFFKYLSFSVNLQNILDAKIYDSRGQVGPGRFITLGFGLKL
jgi:iron complex outermembrane recepter protein